MIEYNPDRRRVFKRCKFIFTGISTSRRLHVKGFTLIELLVVISIISLLVSILLPSLSAAKDLAKAVVCQSNLRNIGLGVGYYSSENDDKLIPILSSVSSYGSDNIYKPTWRSLLCPFMEVNPESLEIFKCPSDSKKPEYLLALSDKRGRTPGSYGINLSIGLHDYDTSLCENTLEDIVRPADTLFIADLGYPNAEDVSNSPENWNTDRGYLNYGYMRLPRYADGNDDPYFYNGDTWDIYPRHQKLANSVFYDGTVNRVSVTDDLIDTEPGSGDCIYDNK